MQIDSERSILKRELRQSVSDSDALQALSLTQQMLAGTPKPADYSFCASCLAQITDAIQDAGAKSLRTYWIRSVTVEPLLPYVFVEAALNNFVLDLHVGGYGTYLDDLANPMGSVARFNPDLVFISLDLEDLAGTLPGLCSGVRAEVDTEIESAIARIHGLLRAFRRFSTARIVLQGILTPDRTSLGEVADANLPGSLRHAVQRLNLQLSALCRTITECVFFDMDHAASSFGRSRWQDRRMFLASRLQVASDASPSYAYHLVRSFSVFFRAPRKVLCTDLDNTLWGGVVGEDGPEGIVTGSTFPGNCYLDYQRYLGQLSSRGILLAICSKNNEADVREAFELRATDLALKLDDFVAVRINWNDKVKSISEIADELSLGLDSFVFVDDNPAECEAIRRQIPEVAVINAPLAEPWRLVEMLAHESFFDTTTVTTDDLGRAQEYRVRAQRVELERNSTSREDFLAEMEIVCTFLNALDAPLARSVQLLAKTNQFNLTTRRRSAAEVEVFASTPGDQAVAIRVRDRFGDIGVVGLALASIQGATCIIDSFLLSCRVIGRGIETALIARVAENAIRSGAKRLLGEFVQTKKNSPFETFYLQHGFIECPPPAGSSANSRFYELDLTISKPAQPNWITCEGNDTHELSSSPIESA